MNATYLSLKSRKKRFYIISFFVAPVLFSIGYYMGTKIVIALDYTINRQGHIFVVIVLFLSYLRCVYGLYKTLLGKKATLKK